MSNTHRLGARVVTSRSARHGALAFLCAVVVACGSDSLDPDGSAVANVRVSPDRLSVGVGSTATLTVEVLDAAGNKLEGRAAFWSSGDPTVATVTNGGTVTGVRPGNVQIAASVEGKSGIADVTVNPRSVASVRLTPTDRQLLVSQTVQLVAETFDNTGAPLTGRVVAFSSSNANVATVSNTGLVTAVAPGGATITATSEGRSATATITVSSVPIATVTVTPANNTIVVGQTAQLTAEAKDASGNVLGGRIFVWTSSNSAVASVSSTGLVTGVAAGSATVTAAAEGRSGSASFVVQVRPVGSVIVSPSQVSITQGQTSQLSVQVTDDNGNVLTGRPVSFSSSQVTIATVSQSGLVTAVGPGSATITATSEGKSGTASVTVTLVPVATVTVVPGSVTTFTGQTVQLTAETRSASGAVLTGRTVAWTTGAPGIASVSTTGVVTALATGTAVILATSEGRVGSSTITITVPPVNTVAVAPKTATLVTTSPGNTIQLTATLRDVYNNVVTRPVGWTTNDATIAEVSSTGLVTAKKVGTATITATSEGRTDAATITVVPHVTVAPATATVFVNWTLQLTATVRNNAGQVVSNPSVSWNSSSNQTATVSNSGLVRGVATGGPVTITASSSGNSGTAQITVALAPVNEVTVSPSSATLSRLLSPTRQLTATLRDAQGNVLTGRTVTWSSTNTAVATVNQSGLVTAGNTNGTTPITATSEGKSGTSNITVNP